MNSLLILVSVLSFSLNSIMSRCFQVYVQKHEKSRDIYLAASILVAAVVYFILGIKTESLSGAMVLPAMAFGVFFAAASIFSFKCSKMGYMSISSVIINLSMLIPVAFSFFVYKEPIFVTTIIGFVFLVITFILSSLGSKQQSKGDYKKWLVFIVLAFIANGMSAVVQKQYKLESGAESIMLFMSIAYFTAAVIFSASFIFGKGLKEVKEYEINRSVAVKFVVMLLLGGLGSCAGNGLLAILCTEVDAGILYPCINGGLCIVASLASFIIFKEQLSKAKILAIISGVTAIVFLNI